MFGPLGAVDMASPLDVLHPLNQGVGDRWLILPESTVGPRWPGLAGRYPGVPTGYASPATATSGFKGGSTRPGGWGHLQFDGVDDHVVLLPNFSTILSGAGSYTIGCWFRCGTTAANYPTMLGWGLNSGSGPGFGILQIPGASGFLYAAMLDSANNTSANLPALAGLDNQWHRIDATIDRKLGKVSIYLDGTLGAATTIAAGTISSSQPLMAARRDAIYWSGGQDDIVFAPRAWSASEVAANYQESRAGYPNVLNRVRPSVFLLGGNAPASNPLTIAATFPALSVAATLASTNPAAVAATFPPLTASATLTQSNPVSVAASFPAMTASAVLSSTNPATVAASFPALTAAATLTQTNPLTVAASFPPLSAAVVLGQGSSLVVAATFPGLSASAVLSSANPLTVAASFPRLAVSASLENGTPAIEPGGCWPWDWWIGGEPTPDDPFEIDLQAFLEDRLDRRVYLGLIDEEDPPVDDTAQVVLTLLGSTSPTKLSGAAGATYWRYQIACYSTAPATAARTVEQIRRLLQPFRGWMGSNFVKNVVLQPRTGGFDPTGQGADGGTYRRSSEWQFCVREPIPSD